AARNDFDSLGSVVSDESGVAAEEIGIILRPHVAAAAPGFVADAEKRQAPGPIPAVRAPQLRERAARAGRDVFDPIRHLLRGIRADIARYVRVGADHLHEVEELVGAER